MVPKEEGAFLCRESRFGTILFDMVPKDNTIKHVEIQSFGTILFDMVPKGNRRFGNVVSQKLIYYERKSYD